MILFIHEGSHVGGGPSFVCAYKKILKEQRIAFDFVEGQVNQKLINNIIRKKYTKVFLHIYTPKYLPLVLLLKILKIPIVLTVYGLWFLEYKSQSAHQQRREKYWLRCAQGIFFLCSHRLIALSVYEKNLIVHYFSYTEHKIVIIPGGVDNARFYPVSSSRKLQIRRELHLPEHSKIVLIASRLEKRKGVDLAITAFKEIQKKYKKSMLCILFPTSEYGFVEINELFHQVADMRIGEKVHFVTGVSQTYIPLYYQASDVFIMSSRELETFGLTTIEAAASGCIPVGFRVGATPELLEQIDNNLLAFPVVARTLTQTINRALSMPQKKKQHILTKCHLLANRYVWDNISQSLRNALV